MSVVAPIVALSAIVPVLVSLATGARPTVAIGAGIVLALAGAGLTAAAADPDAGDEDPAAVARAGARARSLWVAVISACGFGVALVALDAAADSDPLWSVVVARTCAVVVVASLLAVRRARVDTARPGLARVGLVGVLDAASMTLYVLASNEGMLAVVSVLASLYPIVTVLLARVVLGERMRAVQVAGVAIAFGGIALIASG